MIALEKVRGSHMYRLSYHDQEMTKLITWEINPDDVDLDVLLDVIQTAQPLPATIPAIPVGPWRVPELTPEQWAIVQPVIPGLENYGAQAADKAAHEEEMRLRNMGGALRTGINLSAEDIPVFEDGDLPSVNWSV
jgi:hypothetical protein